MDAQQLHIFKKKKNILHVGKTSDKENVCKGRGQEIRTSELIRFYYFYYYWGADNRTLYFNVEVTPERERVFGCVSAGWSIEYNSFFYISPAVTHGSCLVPLIWPSGSCQDARRLSPSPSRMWTKWVLDCYFYKISPRPHNQNKSTTRAFPAAMTSRKPSPSPSRVNRKREAKRLSVHLRAFSSQFYVIKGDILI